MMNLFPQHRFHIPNSLAMFAALLLLVISVVGFESNHEVYSSGQETMTSAKVIKAEKNSVNAAAEHKSRGLNLGLLLFRRG